MSRAEVRRSAVPGHPLALVLATLSANAAVDIGGVGSVLEVLPAGCRQGGLQRRRPPRIGLGQPPDLIGRQSQVAKQTAERLAAREAVQELLPHSIGSRSCALARHHVPWASLCARRHCVQRQPVCQPADVPCRATARTLAAAHRSPLRDLIPRS
jgi:hypothetical protein